MKKIFIIFISFILLLAACSKNTTTVPLTQLPEDYSLDDAKSDDCVVFEDSDITYGQKRWDTFIKETENGNEATVRLAFYYTLGDPSRYSKEHYEEITCSSCDGFKL